LDDDCGNAFLRKCSRPDFGKKKKLQRLTNSKNPYISQKISLFVVRIQMVEPSPSLQADAVFLAVEQDTLGIITFMKKQILQPILILLFLATAGAMAYAVPIVLRVLENNSLRFILLFLLLILASNILAKIAKKYINL
jgi:hypothetical protein